MAGKPVPASYGYLVAISPYVASIRERIGTDLLLMPTVAVIPHDSEGRILLVRHADSGRWANIGGAIEPDETPEAAALRETAEEASVSVRLDRLITAVGGPDYRLTYPNGDQAACVAIVYAATLLGGQPAPDQDETTEVGWFHPDTIAELDLNPLNRQLLAEALPRL